jgi:hypothetical protein
MAYTVSDTLYYCKASGKAYTASGARWAIGFDPSTVDASVLPSRGVYTVIQAEPDFDERLYDVGAAIYTINGDNADQTWTQTAKPLADAKTAGIAAMKEKANTDAIAASNGFPVIALAASASKSAASRDATVQSALDGVNAVLTQLVADVATINSATTVDEINAVVNA